MPLSIDFLKVYIAFSSVKSIFTLPLFNKSAMVAKDKYGFIDDAP
jgi:hypothetical protein